jgi:hypothetical protein
MKMVIYMEYSLRTFGQQVLPLVHYHLSHLPSTFEILVSFIVLVN